MRVKAAALTPPVKSKTSNQAKGGSEVQVARISSVTTLQVTRTQVVCTIIVSLITLLGVAVANLDKFIRSAPMQKDELAVRDRVKRVGEFMEKNQRDVENARTVLLLKGVSSEFQNRVIRVLYRYQIQNIENREQFARETELLSRAMQTGNTETIWASKQRLTQIALGDASTLQNTIHTINQAVSPFKVIPNRRMNRTTDEPKLENLLGREPVKELAILLPIKHVDSPEKPEVATADVPHTGEAMRFGRRPVKLTVLTRTRPRTSAQRTSR